MQLLLSEIESLKLLVLYQHFNFANITSQLIIITIFALLGIIPMSFPLIYYAKKLQEFVKYSKMWQAWKKLFWGWVSMIIGGALGVIVLIYILYSGVLAQLNIPIVLLVLILSPLIGCIVITIILTFIGIRQFYKNAKKAIIGSS